MLKSIPPKKVGEFARTILTGIGGAVVLNSGVKLSPELIEAVAGAGAAVAGLVWLVLSKQHDDAKPTA